MYVGKTDKTLYPDGLSWDELKALGKNQTGQGLEERLANIAINQCCTLVYTSGTTGNPKGVMLSHDNLYWTGMAAHDCKSLIFAHYSKSQMFVQKFNFDKTSTFSRVFHPEKSTIFSGNQSLIFGQKMKISNSEIL